MRRIIVKSVFLPGIPSASWQCGERVMVSTVCVPCKHQRPPVPTVYNNPHKEANPQPIFCSDVTASYFPSAGGPVISLALVGFATNEYIPRLVVHRSNPSSPLLDTAATSPAVTRAKLKKDYLSCCSCTKFPSGSLLEYGMEGVGVLPVMPASKQQGLI